MGRIGNKPAAFFLRGLEPFCQVVKLVSQNSQLVVSAHRYLVGVVTFLDDPHGVHNLLDPQREAGGIDNRENDQYQFKHDGNPQQAALQKLDQSALGSIELRHVHTADDAAIAENRGGGPGIHGTGVILPGENVISGYGADDLRKQNQLPNAEVVTVIKGGSSLIRYDQPCHR